MTVRHFFEIVKMSQLKKTNLDKAMKTIHDTGINCLSDKRVVDHKVLRNFPVAFLNECLL